jgi:hypothetical protein
LPSMGLFPTLLLRTLWCKYYILNNHAYFVTHRPFAKSRNPVINDIFDGIKGCTLGVGDAVIPTLQLSPQGPAVSRLYGVCQAHDCSRMLLSHYGFYSIQGMNSYFGRVVPMHLVHCQLAATITY